MGITLAQVSRGYCLHSCWVPGYVSVFPPEIPCTRDVRCEAWLKFSERTAILTCLREEELRDETCYENSAGANQLGELSPDVSLCSAFGER